MQIMLGLYLKGVAIVRICDVKKRGRVSVPKQHLPAKTVFHVSPLDAARIKEVTERNQNLNGGVSPGEEQSRPSFSF